MTELVLNATASATPLAKHLTTQSSSSGLVPYFGALTAHHFDAPERETGALLRGAAVQDLGWLRRVAVRGEDRLRWLSGMVTNAVETLADSSGAYNLVLNAQGRIQGDAYVWRSGETLEIETSAEQLEPLLTHLDHFIIMDDVELVSLPDQTAIGITGPAADRILTGLGLSPLDEALSLADGTVGGVPVRIERRYGTIVPHYALWANVEHVAAVWQAIVDAGATPVGSAALETLRIVEGIPAYGIDIQSRDLAQETGQTRALNFTKGCYLGQEIVERIRSRGQVHRYLRSIELIPDNEAEVPATGTELRGSSNDGKPAGSITSVAAVRLNEVTRVFGIAMVRSEAEVGGKLLVYASGKAQILKTPPKFAAA